MSAREDVLQLIRRATADVTERNPDVDVPVEWTYGRALPTADVIADFVEKVEDYKAAVRRCPEVGAAETIIEALSALDARSVVVPDGLPDAWVQALSGAGFELHRDEPVLSHAQLNSIDAVLTTAAVGMADSGTIALDHGDGQGRRALTLLPDRHIVVVREDQVVSDVPEGMARLAPALRARRPVTWLSGGSATSDIELSRVEGVHGPRHLSVVLVAGAQ
ncbi:LutC/YkgG family protein [Tessaracoccus flavus]|uniref:Lactate utilization protein C n=1 Tax=Tessaracoccus flavus TaxID=1610493 RepID=A0A1Q2CDY0_9ACTN|nr:lactate utilization protein C [Tessaracoccus flavus]AQP44329.1 lactate utilization protein C [Tessaracoccus flavus]SDY66158.1 L-lactate dehydrogenase complex protein LldG [Tessaracoccus flavus]